MRKLCLVLPLGIFLIWFASCKQAEPAPEKGGGMQQSDSPKPQSKAQAPEPADNSFCLVCHMDFEDEELTAIHRRVGVGCEKCHGPSYDHSSDEDHLTPPDIMYPKGKINSFCMTCHKEKDLAELEEHDEVLADKSGEIVCVDCHGKHRKRIRERRWNKRTGELIWSEGQPTENAKLSAREGLLKSGGGQ